MGLKIICLFLCFSSLSFSQTLKECRENFNLSVKNELLCKRMINSLSLKKNDPVFVAYLGAYQTVWANHVLSPVAKWKTFSAGKKNLEEAVKLNSELVEIRILRYAVQQNAPKFLGYSTNIQEDKTFILNSKSTIKDEGVLNFIKAVNL